MPVRNLLTRLPQLGRGQDDAQDGLEVPLGVSIDLPGLGEEGGLRSADEEADQLPADEAGGAWVPRQVTKQPQPVFLSSASGERQAEQLLYAIVMTVRPKLIFASVCVYGPTREAASGFDDVSLGVDASLIVDPEGV